MLGPIVCDITGTVLTQDDINRIRHPLVGMVILFTRNYANPRQLKELCDAIHAAKPGLLISVDHEGGRVQRFREGFTAIPAMQEYGKLYRSDPEQAVRAVTAAGYVMASELRACGVDFTFAPVLDLDWGRSEIIGHRAFSLDPRVVTRLARGLTQGLALAGMANCGKHFPGHGYVLVDSHVGLPEDDRDQQQVLHADALPYAWMGVGLSSIMTAHVRYPAIDSEPATFSAKIVTEILRHELEFSGFVFSDDLSMGGALGAGGIVQRGQKALLAGCDGLIVCNHPEETDRLLDGLQWERTKTFTQRASRLVPGVWTMSYDALRASDLYQQAIRQMQLIVK